MAEPHVGTTGGGGAGSSSSHAAGASVEGVEGVEGVIVALVSVVVLTEGAAALCRLPAHPVVAAIAIASETSASFM